MYYMIRYSRIHHAAAALLTAAAVTAGAASCAEQADMADAADGTPVTISVATDGGATDGVAAATRAAATLYGNTFADGDQFYATFPGDKTTVDATTYTLGEAVAAGYNPATPQVQPYVRSGATGATVRAYFPWRAGGQAPNAGPATKTWTVSQDQTADAAYFASDLMYAEGDVQADGTVKTTGQQRLVFSHRMAKVIVNITNSLTGSATVQAVNLVQGYRTVNIQAPETLTPGTTLTDPIGQTTPLNAGTASGCACLLPPQTIVKDQRFIEVKTSQGPAYFALSTDTELKGGYAYTASVTLNRASLGATTAVTAWTAQTLAAGEYAEQRHLDFQVGSQTFRMVGIPAGTFTNSSYSATVTVSNPYYIGQVEVTNGLYDAVMGATRSSSKGAKKPIIIDAADMKWSEIQKAGGFIDRLNRATVGQRPEGYSFRLPTNAEWEWAAREANPAYANTYAGPDDMVDQYAWYKDHDGALHDVATREANRLGLYDITGNAFEHCVDAFASYPDGSSTDPYALWTSGNLSIRGGSANRELGVAGVGYIGVTSDTYSANVWYGYRLALTKDVERIAVKYPAWTAADSNTETIPFNQYDSHDAFGLYVVNEAGAVLYSNLRATLKPGSSNEIDLEALRRQGIALSSTARYFLYYPYRPSVPAVTATATTTTADGFFNGWAANAAWAPATDQQTLDQLKVQDLQTGASVPTTSRTTVTIEMAHKHALAVLKMASTTANVYRVWQVKADGTFETSQYNASGSTYYALDEFQGNQPYRVGQRNTAALRCYFITKAATDDQVFTSNYRIINANGATVATQWGIDNGSGGYDGKYNIQAGQYQVKQTSTPGFKNAALVYTNKTASTAYPAVTGLENGAPQAYVLPFPTDQCAYQIECWGAQGGNMISEAWSGVGGLGGYVSGITTSKLDMQAGQRLYVYCGGAGMGYNLTKKGGWNGGGNSGGGASGGGGASDVRTVNAAWNDATGLQARLIVAGGGGGSNDFYNNPDSGHGSPYGNGGNGGKTGGNAYDTYSGVIPSGSYGSGATQSSAGVGGGFGYGGTASGDGGGGGGGWYGGAPGNTSAMGGGGGSSYIRPAYFTNATYINGGTIGTTTTMPDPAAANGTNKTSQYTGTFGGTGTTGNINSNASDTNAALQANERGFVRITCMPYGQP